MLSRLTPFLVTLSLMTSMQVHALQLSPLTTFGPNGDGTLRPGDYPFLTSDGTRLQRGMAYNPTTGHLIIVNRNPGVESINVIDAFTGADVGSLDLSAATLGGASGFVYDQVGVADDGAIYVGNLTTSGTLVEFILYRWENEAAAQTRVYGPANPGDTTAGNSRWGDTLAVRGAGVNTEVLITSRGALAAILRPTDSSLSTFTATALTTDVSANALGYGLAFGTGNTFYGKAASSEGLPLYHFSYDLNAGTATTLHVYGISEFPGRVGPLAVQTTSNLLAAIEMTPGTAPDRVRLYDVTTPASPPVFLDRQDVAVWTNANSIFSGAVAFGASNVYVFNSDNGVVAFTVTNGTQTFSPIIFGEPQSQVVQLTSNAVFSVGADGTEPLTYLWRFNGTNITGATTNTYSIASAQLTNAGGYSVVVTNDHGAVTSAVATLNVLASYGNTLFYEPFAYAAGSVLDGQGGWGDKTGTGPSFTNVVGNLSIPYLARSQSNHVLLYNANGVTTRKQIGSYSQGALYFSFIMKLDDRTPPGTTSETTAGLASGLGTTYTPKINIEAAGDTNYTIGIYKGSGTTFGGVATNADGTPILFNTNDVVFVVGRIVFNPSTADDTCDLWVNPDPSTFGAATPPTPSVGPIGAGRADVTPIDHFVFRFANGYNGRHFDETRVGFDWAGVTPPANPALDISLNGPNAKLRWPTNISTGYILESIRAWNDPDGWQPAGSPVVEGVSNTVTVPISGTAKFFRLKK